MGAAQLMGFVRVERCVDSSEHHIGTTIACYFPDLVAAQGICGVDANADNIAGLNLSRVDRRQRLIHDAGIAKARRCRCRKNIQPSRGNDCSAERDFTWINEVNAHALSPSLGALCRETKTGWRISELL